VFNQLLNSFLESSQEHVLAPGIQKISLPLHSQPLNFTLSYSPRRTRISLQVSVDGIVCKAPVNTPAKYIHRLFEQKQAWLLQTLARLESFETSRMDWVNGGEFLYLGDWVKATFHRGGKFHQRFCRQSATLTITVPTSVKHVEKYTKQKFNLFIQQQAEEVIRPRFEQLVSALPFAPTGLEFKIYQRRWGCCYKHGLIRINPQLIGATPSVIDCVLIHELCHLEHMDHSSAFWLLNDKHCGKCKENDAWLKHYAYALKN